MEGCQGGRKDTEVKSLKVPLKSLVCDGSYQDLEATLAHVAGIVDADIDKKLKVAYIDYDLLKISQEQIMEKISQVGCRVQEF